MEAFLRATRIIDWQQPSVRSKALELAKGASGDVQIARRCFEWVRDNIQHSADFKRGPMTCAASEVLANAAGYCYAKSHLLVALLRATAFRRVFATSGSASMTKARRTRCTDSTPSFYASSAGTRWIREGNKPGVHAFLPASGAPRVSFEFTGGKERY
jgi:hypothetical protein